MLGNDDSAYLDEFIPTLETDDWHYYKKQIKAPANIKAVKIGAKAEKKK